MAVYTEVDRKAFNRVLEAQFNLGSLKSFEGIPEGIENTNYRFETEKGPFVLTLFEKRTPEEALPFFLDLMEHLAKKGIPAPRPVSAKNQNQLFECQGKKAVILPFLPGSAVIDPTPGHCFSSGIISAEMHAATGDFGLKRENPLGLSGLRGIFSGIRGAMRQRLPHLYRLAETEFEFQTRQPKPGLPEAVVHADLFPDNVFFEGQKITGVIDFYFAAEDSLAYDLAVTANSWCFTPPGAFLNDNFSALIEGYETLRPLKPEEKLAFPALLRRAALRFLLTRSEDWLFHSKGVIGIVKDPEAYGKILSFHQKRSHIEDYF